MQRLSEGGDPLEAIVQAVTLEAFLPGLMGAPASSDGAKGGRQPYDRVAMFKVLVLAAQNNRSHKRMEFLIRGPLDPAAGPRLRTGPSDAGRERDPALWRETACASSSAPPD